MRALWDRDTAFVCNEKSPPKHYPKVCGVYHFSTSRFTAWMEFPRGPGLETILTGTSRKEVYECTFNKVYRYKNKAGVVSRELLVTLEDLSIEDCALSPDGSLLLLMTYDNNGGIRHRDRDRQLELLVWNLRNGSVKGKVPLLKDEFKSTSRVTLENAKEIEPVGIMAVSNRIAAMTYVRDKPTKLFFPPPNTSLCRPTGPGKNATSWNNQ